MEDGIIGSDTGPDVTTALMTGYPVAEDPSAAAPAAATPDQSQAATGAEAGEEAPGTAGGEKAQTTTTPEAKADGAEDSEQLATAEQYKTLTREQAISELEKRDRRIAGSEYGVLKLQAEHREQLAQLDQARQLMEIGEKNDPKAILDWFADYLSSVHNVPKESLLGSVPGQSGQSFQANLEGLKFNEDGFIDGSDKDLASGILGEVQKMLAPILQQVGDLAKHSPLLGSLAQKEGQTAQEAAMRAKAETEAPLFKSAAKVKHGIELTDEEALNTALYKASHPNLDIEDCVFLCNKEKVKGSMLGKTPATGPTMPNSSGARESQHGNPGPGAGRAAQLTAIALNGYPEV